MKKKPAKVYKYKIKWVELSPEKVIELFSQPLPHREYVQMSVESGYSAEYFRQLFIEKPNKVNQPVYDAIVKHLEGKEVVESVVVETVTPIPVKNGKAKVTDLNDMAKAPVITDPSPKSNFTIDTMPVRGKNESALEFAERKSNWKKKNIKL